MHLSLKHKIKQFFGWKRYKILFPTDLIKIIVDYLDEDDDQFEMHAWWVAYLARARCSDYQRLHVEFWRIWQTCVDIQSKRYKSRLLHCNLNRHGIYDNPFFRALIMGAVRCCHSASVYIRCRIVRKPLRVCGGEKVSIQVFKHKGKRERFMLFC